MIAVEAALSFAWRHWKLILGGVVAAALVLALSLARSDARRTHDALTAEKASHALDIATWRAAYAKAIADNLADVRAKEGDAATITENKQHDLEAKLADARAAAARYAGRVRPCGADQGSAVKAPLGETAGTPSEPSGTSGDAIVPERDLEVCAANTVKAKGWQTWYSELRARYNAETP